MHASRQGLLVSCRYVQGLQALVNFADQQILVLVDCCYGSVVQRSTFLVLSVPMIVCIANLVEGL